MSIIFSSSASADLVMVDDVATQLLDLLGKARGSIGVIMPSEFPEALYRLAAVPVAVSDVRRAGARGAVRQDSRFDLLGQDDVDQKVRAHPLVAMIRQAEAVDAPVVWQAAVGFSPGGDPLSE